MQNSGSEFETMVMATVHIPPHYGVRLAPKGIPSAPKGIPSALRGSPWPLRGPLGFLRGPLKHITCFGVQGLEPWGDHLDAKTCDMFGLDL